MFRETTIRIFGIERVIRTERAAGTVKALEGAHTRAVKAAIEAMYAPAAKARAAEFRARANECRAFGRRPLDEDASRAREALPYGVDFVSEAKRLDKEAKSLERRWFTAPKDRCAEMRRPHPKVRYNLTPADPLISDFYEPTIDPSE
ncbi:hypothetical protein IPZ58_07645 [Streptomyces roseoverticillatus]|uniref:hypothetical protein n=1 Tax=Streptomyces roseoverticillatus TaxID=66429 RepID=UPI001F3DEEE3|nr:hypothetical protein [Streptomyces roseoverticillatus]MCF3101453.1 hypothetical protein [Streptomyces roseoverticillatus]